MTIKPSDLYAKKCAAGELSPDPVQQALVERFDGYHAALTQKPKRRLLNRFRDRSSIDVSGVYLWGGVGRGKSLLMDLFFAACGDKIRKERHHFHAFMIDTHDAIFAARKAGKTDPLAVVAKQLIDRVNLLCFDEMFVKDIADAMLLSRLFTMLFDAGVFVVFTSNCAPDDLYKDGIQRESFVPFIETLKFQMDVIKIEDGQDYRQSIKGASTIELRHASKNHVIIEVKGREHTFISPQPGVIEANFEYLCEGNLGSEDYLVIARNFQTIILKSVPNFEWENRDAAMRFVKLVDILYDHGISFVCADVVPETLFDPSVSLMESERTVSRLKEMSNTTL